MLDRRSFVRTTVLALAVAPSLAGAAESTAGIVPKTPPPLPWHLVDLWWKFAADIPHFETLDVDVTLDRDVPTGFNLYISPLGLGTIGGVECYGGLQTNANGWPSKDRHEREHFGKGAIFSRWGKGKLSVAQARGATGTHYEAADYEGDFVSVRRAFPWTRGTYTWSLRACDVERIDGRDYTWISCFVTSRQSGETRFIGSLRFEGQDLTYGRDHAAFVEIYSTDKLPESAIPEVKVTFDIPRVNGRTVKLTEVRAIYPDPASEADSGSPDVAKAVAEGSSVVVTVGPEFRRDPKERKVKLEVKPAG